MIKARSSDNSKPFLWGKNDKLSSFILRSMIPCFSLKTNKEVSAITSMLVAKADNIYTFVKTLASAIQAWNSKIKLN